MWVGAFMSSSSPYCTSASKRMSGYPVVRPPQHLMLLLVALFAAASAESVTEATHEEIRERINSPMPYGFKYEAVGEDGGGHTREETADGSGRVVGSYTIFTSDGLERRVYYEADENGFRAHVETNEPGTKTSNPADVTIISHAGDSLPNAATTVPRKTTPDGKTTQSTTETTTGLPEGVILPPRYRPGGGRSDSAEPELIMSRVLTLSRREGPAQDNSRPLPFPPHYSPDDVARSPLLRLQPGPSGIVPIGPIHVSRTPVHKPRPGGGPTFPVDYRPSRIGPGVPNVPYQGFGVRPGSGLRPVHPSYEGSVREPASTSGGIFSPSQVAPSDGITNEQFPGVAGIVDGNAPSSEEEDNRTPFSQRLGQEQRPGAALRPHLAGFGGRVPGAQRPLDGSDDRDGIAKHDGLGGLGGGLPVGSLDGERGGLPHGRRAPVLPSPGGSQGPRRGSSPNVFSGGSPADQSADEEDNEGGFPPNDPRRPFLFTYEAGGPASLVTRTEEADISGRVKGSYTITTADGKTRSVNYKADKSGFQANVHTNEPGTETHDPANVSFVSSARSHTDFGGVQKPYKPRPLEEGHPSPIFIPSLEGKPASPDGDTHGHADPQEIDGLLPPSQFVNSGQPGLHDNIPHRGTLPKQFQDFGKIPTPQNQFPNRPPKRQGGFFDKQNEPQANFKSAGFPGEHILPDRLSQGGQEFRRNQGQPGDKDIFGDRNFQQNFQPQRPGVPFAPRSQVSDSLHTGLPNAGASGNQQDPQFDQGYMAPIPVMTAIKSIPKPMNHAANRHLDQIARENFGPQSSRFDQPSLVSMSIESHRPQNLAPPRRFQGKNQPVGSTQTQSSGTFGPFAGNRPPLPPNFKAAFGSRFGDRTTQRGPQINQVLYSDTPQQINSSPRRSGQPGHFDTDFGSGFEGLIREKQPEVSQDRPTENNAGQVSARHGGGLEFLEELLPFYEKELGINGKEKQKGPSGSNERKPIEHVPIVPTKHKLLCDDEENSKSRDSKPTDQSSGNLPSSEKPSGAGNGASDGSSQPDLIKRKEQEAPVIGKEEFLNYRNPFSGVLATPDRTSPEEVDKDVNNLKRPFLDKDGGVVPILVDGGKLLPDVIPQTVDVDRANPAIAGIAVSDVEQGIPPNLDSKPHLSVEDQKRDPLSAPDPQQNFRFLGNNRNKQTGVRRDPLEFFQKFGVPSRDISDPSISFLQPIRGGGSLDNSQPAKKLSQNGQGAVGNAFNSFPNPATSLRPPQRPPRFGQRLSGVRNPGSLELRAPQVPPTNDVQVQQQFRRQGLVVFPPPPLYRPGPPQRVPGIPFGGQSDTGTPSLDFRAPASGNRNFLPNPAASRAQQKNGQVNKFNKQHVVNVVGAGRNSDNLGNADYGENADVPQTFSFLNTRVRVPDQTQVAGKGIRSQNLQGTAVPQAPGNLISSNKEPLVLDPVPDILGPTNNGRPAVQFTFADTRKPRINRPNFQDDRRNAIANLPGSLPGQSAKLQDPSTQEEVGREEPSPGQLLRKPLLDTNRNRPFLLLQNAPRDVPGTFSFVDTRRPHAVPHISQAQQHGRGPLFSSQPPISGLGPAQGVAQAGLGDLENSNLGVSPGGRFSAGEPRLPQENLPGDIQRGPQRLAGERTGSFVQDSPRIHQQVPGGTRLPSVDQGSQNRGPLFVGTPGTPGGGKSAEKFFKNSFGQQPDHGSQNRGPLFVGNAPRGDKSAEKSFQDSFGQQSDLGLQNRGPLFVGPSGAPGGSRQAVKPFQGPFGQHPDLGSQNRGPLFVGTTGAPGGGRQAEKPFQGPFEQQPDPGLQNRDPLFVGSFGAPGGTGPAEKSFQGSFGQRPGPGFPPQPHDKAFPLSNVGGLPQPAAVPEHQQVPPFDEIREKLPVDSGIDDISGLQVSGPGQNFRQGFGGLDSTRRSNDGRRQNLPQVQRNVGRGVQGSVLRRGGNVAQQRQNVGQVLRPVPVDQNERTPVGPNFYPGGVGAQKEQQLSKEGFEAPRNEEDRPVQNIDQDGYASPIPYAFGYLNNDGQGSRVMHQESRDNSGRVTGFYIVEDVDGRKRTVHYIADKDGFRARVHTNEQGTENLDPADVQMRVENRMPHPRQWKKTTPPPHIPVDEAPVDAVDQTVKS